MINSRLIIYLVYITITIVAGAYLFAGWFYPEAVESAKFHKNVYGIVFFYWLVNSDIFRVGWFFSFQKSAIKDLFCTNLTCWGAMACSHY